MKDQMWRDQLQALANMLPRSNQSLIQSRSDIMAKAGTTFGGLRKHYEIFGWPIAPDFDYYLHLYRRGGIAKRIISAYPFATWRTAPTLQEKGKDKTATEETQFEKQWVQLVDKRKLFHYLERVDRMARMGTYALLFLGYSDAVDYNMLAEPVGALRGTDPWDKLLYLQPYAENQVIVNQWDTVPSSPRFGMPLIYQIQFSLPSIGGNTSGIINQSVLVHFSRVLHVAEDVLESDLIGAPALESIINYLLDLEKLHGSAAEAFFQQHPPGLIFSAQADANIDTTTFTDDDGQSRINDFIHGLKRWLALQGIDVTQIKPELGDPNPCKEMLLELMAGTCGIPKRILVGSERGELASGQDETAWNKRVEERQQNWAEPFVLRPLADELILKGVLPMPGQDGYSVEWSEQEAIGEKDKAEISDKRSSAIQKYASSPNTEQIVPVEVFLREVMGFSQETITECEEKLQELWDKDLEDALNPPEPIALPIPTPGVPPTVRPRTSPIPPPPGGVKK